MAYNTIDEFKLLALIPPEWVDDVELRYPGFTAAQLDMVSELDINAPLRKRYAAPFASPYPSAVKAWEARITAHRVCIRRGVDPTDQQQQDIAEDALTAKVEIKEAANSEHGLYDLPLRADTTETGVSRGGPRSYSEQSPYVWTDVQLDAARDQDLSRRGS